MVLAANTVDTLITTYLEMTSREDFAPAFVRAIDIEIVKMEMPDLGFYKFLYQSVGEEWAWRDRLQLSNSELRRILSSPNTQVHVMYVSGSPGGYVELYRHEDGSVEIAYFGLRRNYMGRAWASTCLVLASTAPGLWGRIAFGCIPAIWTARTRSPIIRNAASAFTTWSKSPCPSFTAEKAPSC